MQKPQARHTTAPFPQFAAPPGEGAPQADHPAAGGTVVECGWGRLIFAQTFSAHEDLATALRAERRGDRDIAFYVAEPQILLAVAPQALFLDPSHCLRLDLARGTPVPEAALPFRIRPVQGSADIRAVNAIYGAHGMVQLPDDFHRIGQGDTVTLLVAEDRTTAEILGAVMGVDHVAAFDDPEGGSSLWSLAVAPQAPHGRMGEYLVRAVADRFRGLGRRFLDLTVMQGNAEAMALYEKLGFRRVPVFSVKCKNSINERLYAGTVPGEGLNPYGRLIVDEASRRGIHTEIIDAEAGFFKLSYGGRSVRCRESLSEFTSAVAMSICDDKRVTHRIVAAAGVVVPEQISADPPEAAADFLRRVGKVVVKPARGEQGRGVAVGITTEAQLVTACEQARQICAEVIVEHCVEGEDLRIVVIDYQVVAAALRRPPRVVGDGHSSIGDLIARQSRRRAAATGGESTIPVDAETRACLAEAGVTLDDVLPRGVELVVRRAANLHTGGTIHDVTDRLHPALAQAAIAAARAIDIPVTGIDLIVRAPEAPDYVFIEANERPGLANHEPQPTAERFIDLLFPLSVRPASDSDSAPSVV
ncbi:N-acetylglutaminylglutamine synthetase [Plastorhodobacter daqingensis]|uniref:N-acetylglutaminylglutamine synthetase n=1 Tax=Plastorhodobacter daqingensis TaxID=1387281 RepID=A0ABW2UHZ4_9RHOB